MEVSSPQNTAESIQLPADKLTVEDSNSDDGSVGTLQTKDEETAISVAINDEPQPQPEPESEPSPVIDEQPIQIDTAPKLSFPKKRLTLKERLAMAAKRTASTEDSKPSSVSTRESSTDISSQPKTAEGNLHGSTNSENEPDSQFKLPENFKELTKEELVDLLEKSTEAYEKQYTGTKELLKQNELLQKEHQDLIKSQQQTPRRVQTPIGNDALRKKLEEKEIQIKELLEEGSKLSMKEVTLTQTIKKMKQKEIDLEEELTNTEKENESLHTKVSELEAELETLKQSERNVKVERHGHESLQVKYDKLSLEKDVIYNELKEFKLRKLDVQLANTKKQLDDEIKANTTLQNKLDKLTNQYNMLKEESRNEKSQLDYKLSREKSKYLESIEESTNEIKRLENKMESLRLQSEASIDKSSEINGIHSQPSSSISIDLLQLQYTNAQENWKLIESTYLKKIANLESDIEILTQKDINYSKKIKTLTNDIKMRASEFNELMENETALRLELEEMNKQVAKLKQDLELQKHDYENLRRDNENEKNALEKKIQALEDDKARLTQINKLRLDTNNQSLQSTSVAVGNGAMSNSSSSSSIPSSNSFYLNDLNGSTNMNYYRTQRSVSSASIDNIGFGESSMTPRISSYGGNGRGYPNSSSSLYFNSPVQNYSIPSNIPQERIDESSIQNISGSTDDLHASSPIYGVRSSKSNMTLNRSYSRDEFETAHSSTIGGGGGGASSSMNGGNNIQMMGKLSSHIRRLEVEVMTLKDEVNELNAQKQEASNEIIRLLKENEMVESYKAKITTLQEDFNTLNANYDTTLELLGEKSERCGELEADVDDLKDMMRQQVQQLVEMQESFSKR
ncbi:hypothetical protein CANARDRAFT_5904 [[Candida] arabinofermentans NRRL YB-2248]|uniref:TATA element modulatory factor 1 TATA binding domain-containing protein n=1 Tax=[Candida] arabinofermentans NRRL YB-2248 TaxID=983967 RepID=A0A1E4T6K3_9ASCO|nr:hypothetical protein CANARDRAFT_5904 [[Candida] arabinofermentans NRRL YB-2248]